MLTARQLEQKILRYLPEADTSVVCRAYAVAREAHAGQERYSGEPYFSHCVATARHLIEMQLDPTTVAAGLLHDVPEDTHVSLGEITEEFGDEIAFLVGGVTKLSKVRLDPSVTTEEVLADHKRTQASENLRKMLLAMAQDIRVVLIKLADRMHNMETLSAVPERKQRRIALETLEIYAPLAERLGMGEVKGRLQDLAFPFVDPDGYAWIKTVSAPMYAETDRYLRRVMRFVEGELAEHGIEASVHGRAKHLYSLYMKMRNKDQDLSKIYDLIAVRILVNDVPACYETLGLLHQHWKPLLGRIKDYIALPKPNGYQSLHTTVFCLSGRVVEFQIRTQQMHLEAEYGIAAHWGYKERMPSTLLRAGRADGKLAWVQQLTKWQEEVSSSSEFLEALKIDTFQHRIFVFTPRGEVRDLPAGATSLDFAYTIHSAVGDRCYGTKINGKLSALSTPLANGDVVEIMTSPKASPKRDWLEMAVTSGARAHIRRALKEREASSVKREAEDTRWRDGESTRVLEEGGSSANGVLRDREAVVIRPPRKNDGEVMVQGRSGFLVRLAQCCQPQPGDSIIGIVTVGKGISVHQRWCQNVQQVGEMGRLVPVAWEGAARQRMVLRLGAYDRQGLTRDIGALVAAHGGNIAGISAVVADDQTVDYQLVVDVTSRQEMELIVGQLQGMPNVYLVEREN